MKKYEISYNKLSYARILIGLTYDLLEDRRTDDVIIRTFLKFFII